jgi:nitroreductase
MNETLDTILKRRSIRSYSDKKISDADMQALLNAALHAPNARNQQIWHFSVLQGRDQMDKMVEIIKENMKNSGDEFLMQRSSDPNYHTFYHAPAVVLISADKNANHRMVDCGAAAQNIALAAESLGIGSCLIASSGLLFASDKGLAMQKDLGIPEGYEHILCVALGYASGDRPETPARNKEVVQYIK